MQFQPFALAIVNDLFDEDLDPDLFQDAADEALGGLTAGDCDGPLDGTRQAQAAQPLHLQAFQGSRRLV
jgi:hypothetical protein